MNRLTMRVALIALSITLYYVSKGQSYSDSASAYQISFINANQHSVFGSGISLMDFNTDGLDDITLATADGDSLVFYVNTGNGFSKIPSLVNHTGEAESVIWVDYDNDGDKDLYVSSNRSPNKLYQNNGALSFVDVSSSLGLSDSISETFGVCWGDYNRDGYLDLYEANRQLLYNETNQLYLNDSAQSFINTSAFAGVADSSHMGFASNFIDFNNDNWPDIFVANDKFQGNQLFKNAGNGTFSNVSVSSSMNVPVNGMTATLGDYNNDGYMDVYVTNTQEGNFLFRNNGNETFTDVTTAMGVAVNGICWGATFFDYDLDGDQDLYVSDMKRDTASRNTLFENTGSMFIAHSPAFPNDISMSLSHAMADFNNDGHLDIISPNQGPDSLQFWLSSSPNTNHWIKLSMEGTISNRDGIGTRIEISAGGKKQYRYTHCGGSYLSQNAGYEIIGLKNDTVVDTLVFHWSSGHIDSLFNYSSNQSYHIVEGMSVIAKLNNFGSQWYCKNDTVNELLKVENAYKFSQFQWSTGDTTASITINAPGDYWLVAQTLEGIVDSSKILSVLIDSLALSSNLVSDTNNQGLGSATVNISGGFPPFQYQWSDPLAQTLMTATSLQQGSYWVYVTDSLGCSDSLAVTVPNHIGLRENESKYLILYPNPASNKFEIHNISDLRREFRISVYKADGTSVDNFVWNCEEKLQVNTSKWAKGLYLVFIENNQSGEFIECVKLVIE